MRFTFKQIEELERRANTGDVDAVRHLAEAARANAIDGELYRIETEDGLVRVVNVQQYLSLTATDLTRAKVTLVRGN